MKIQLASRFQSANSSITGLIQIAPKPAVQTVQISDKDSTLSRGVDDIVHKGKKRHESTNATRNLPEFLKPKALDKVGVDRKQGIDILSTSGLHKNKVSYSTNDLPNFCIPINKREISKLHKNAMVL